MNGARRGMRVAPPPAPITQKGMNMTVAELIVHLQTLPQDLTVILGCGTDIAGTNQVDFNAHFGADPESPCDPVIIIG